MDVPKFYPKLTCYEVPLRLLPTIFVRFRYAVARLQSGVEEGRTFVGSPTY